MLLKLTEEQRNYVKITVDKYHFKATMGETDPIIREYYNVPEMLREFEENYIESADFDSYAHEVYKKALEKAYNLSEALS